MYSLRNASAKLLAWFFFLKGLDIASAAGGLWQFSSDGPVAIGPVGSEAVENGVPEANGFEVLLQPISNFDFWWFSKAIYTEEANTPSDANLTIQLNRANTTGAGISVCRAYLNGEKCNTCLTCGDFSDVTAMAGASVDCSNVVESCSGPTHTFPASSCSKPNDVPGVGRSCLQDPVGDFLPPAFNYDIPRYSTYGGIAYNDLPDNGTTVAVGIPVLFDKDDFAGSNVTDSVWYASLLEIFSEEGPGGGENVTLIGNYVNNIESVSSPGTGTRGLAKCEAYLNGKKCKSCTTCVKSVSPSEIWRVSDKTGAYFDCSEEMNYCVGSTANGINSRNIEQCQEFTAPGFGACFEAYTPVPSASVAASTSSVILTIAYVTVGVWML